MKERGMIFNGEMVRAILDGRKTQTRRIVKPQPEVCPRGGHWWPSNVFKTMLHVEEEMQNGKGGWGGLVGDACPFGDVGDRIWVRETWTHESIDAESGSYSPDYRATANGQPLDGRWIPSIHMPRWASRITLEITDVRVERLNSISEQDALAEGIRRRDSTPVTDPAYCNYLAANLNEAQEWFDRPSDSFISLWQSIYGADSWQHSPWVWVIEFKRVEGGAE